MHVKTYVVCILLQLLSSNGDLFTHSSFQTHTNTQKDDCMSESVSGCHDAGEKAIWAQILGVLDSFCQGFQGAAFCAVFCF